MQKEKLPAEEIRSALGYFTGTAEYHRFNGLSRLVCTDGALEMARLCGAYWLLDLIASHQSTVRRKLLQTGEEGCKQFWRFRYWDFAREHFTPPQFRRHFPKLVDEDGQQPHAVAICGYDWKGNTPTRVLARQYLPGTNFPLPEGIDLWVADGVILLPSEY